MPLHFFFITFLLYRIVCVGGDGTLSEIANGYLERCYLDDHIDWHNPDTVLPRPRLPIGVIPTGTMEFDNF